MFIIKQVNGRCRKEGTMGPAGITNGAVVITAPVGKRGRNLPQDVTTIQDALNRVSPQEGGPTPSLVVDGISGSKTESAIQRFQLKHFGWKGADGLVEPGRQTNQKLNEIAGSAPAKGGSGPPAQPSAGSIPPAQLKAGINLALRWINAARRNLEQVSYVIDSKENQTIFGRERSMRLVNLHFKLDEFGFVKRRVLGLLQSNYHRMWSVFQRPGGLWGYDAFQPDPVPQRHQMDYAYTWWGGYFKGGQHRRAGGVNIRLDTVFFCALFGRLNLNFQAFTIVHELAHFVGYPEWIDDHAYNSDAAKMQSMPKELRVLNAETYSNFAWQAGTGRDAPNF